MTASQHAVQFAALSDWHTHYVLVSTMQDWKEVLLGSRFMWIPPVGPGMNTMSLLDLLRDIVLAARSFLETPPASARLTFDSFLSKPACWCISQVWLCWPASTEAV